MCCICFEAEHDHASNAGHIFNCRRRHWACGECDRKFDLRYCRLCPDDEPAPTSASARRDVPPRLELGRSRSPSPRRSRSPSPRRGRSRSRSRSPPRRRLDFEGRSSFGRMFNRTAPAYSYYPPPSIPFDHSRAPAWQYEREWASRQASSAAFAAAQQAQQPSYAWSTAWAPSAAFAAAQQPQQPSTWSTAWAPSSSAYAAAAATSAPAQQSNSGQTVPQPTYVTFSSHASTTAAAFGVLQNNVNAQV